MTGAADDTQPQIVFSERAGPRGRCAAFAMLDAPKSLNALSKTMIDALTEKLAEWRERDDVVCVVLYGSGDRALCAGGDVIGLYRAMREADGGPSATAEGFFAAEYRLDYAIHTYPKPLLCWGTGTVMGGGLGLMAGASHRVVTDQTAIAMPEVGIGLFPDVGAGWFLNRMPGRTGLFLALTGSPVNATDAFLLGLADGFIGSDMRDAVFDALAEVDWQGDTRIDSSLLSQALRVFERAAPARPASQVLSHQDTIARVTDAPDVAGMYAALRDAMGDDPWLQRGAKTMERASPSSMAVAFEQWHSGGHLSVKETFMREFAMAVQFTRHPDFAEGIRALLVDKDRQPAWSPSRLADVSDEHVARHFRLPDDYDENPLKTMD